MNKSLFCITLLLTGLTSCNQDLNSPVDELTTRMTEQQDSIEAPGIDFDFGDTTLTEEIEEISYKSKE